ncbi:hypothetical protein [Chryseobacterium sp. JM1]|uniref:hypothetical protein n=1 Tax=Chryseobacterium sp. JM1 TaxID=1233950 RepID=UPI0004E61C1C|nr:hypothetical protein [Chryseobacterium sp. JM1]KFF16670.1 hypothetical protein IW22_22560 [Chryseobacterium sp. JM1]
MKYINITLFVIIITKLIINGISSTTEGFCTFYDYERNEATKKIADVNDIGHYFWYYTGFNTGYGFFAPNVSSDFIILTKYNEGSFVSSGFLQTREGKLRFLNANGIFLENIKNGWSPKNKEKISYNKAVLKQINASFRKKHNINDCETKVYLYDFPRLYSSDKRINLIPIDSVR